jgi:hypothetical protein
MLCGIVRCVLRVLRLLRVFVCALRALRERVKWILLSLSMMCCVLQIALQVCVAYVSWVWCCKLSLRIVGCVRVRVARIAYSCVLCCA